MEKLQMMVEHLNQILWGAIPMMILLGFGFYFFVQLYRRNIFRINSIVKGSMKILLHQEKGKSAFSALSTALGATLGVGSIIGVASALILGGPGSIFWMWVCAFAGMGLKYGEIVMVLKHRKVTKDGKICAGSGYVLEDCHMPFLGVLFAIFTIFASFGIGNMIPASTIVETLSPYMEKTYLIGLLFLILSVCLLYGSHFILKVCSWFVPIFACFYIIACMYLIVVKATQLPLVFIQIIEDAFQGKAVAGGMFAFLGNQAMRYGISRGIFSHEAGMGSAPLAHGSVSHHLIKEQGYMGVLEVWIDTGIICTMTALVILLHVPQLGNSAVALCTTAFQNGFGNDGVVLFHIALSCFAFSSMLGWIYYGFSSIRYLFHSNWVKYGYCVLFLACFVFGCMMQVNLLWEIADSFNALMMFPNLFALWNCRKEIIQS